MLKRLLTMLVLVSVLSLLSCSHGIPDPGIVSEPESSTGDSVPSGETADDFKGSFPISGLTGKTTEELAELYSPVIYYNESQMEGVLNTPVSLLIKSMNRTVLISYDKETGVFTEACRDPLCDHESCLWGASGSRIYAGSDGLFFLIGQGDATVLYETDFAGAGQRIRYRSSNELSHVVQEGSVVYLLEEAVDEATYNTVCRIVQIPADGSAPEILLEQAGLYYFMPLNGNILYRDPSEGFLLYDRDEKTSRRFGPAEMRPIALCGEFFYYESEGTICRASDYGAGEKEELVTEIEISELVFDRHKVFGYDGSEIYQISDDFSSTKAIYTAETEERITNVILDGNLLCYQYTSGKGSARKHFYVFEDLETGNHLEVVND